MKKNYLYKVNNLNISVKAFSICKSGNTDKENEDALDFNLTNNDNTFVAAVADGSTEGFLSKEWAKTLVKKFCTIDYNFNNINDFHKEFYNSCIHHWSKYFIQYINKRNSSNNPIQWYEESGLSSGAYSSITGINVFSKTNKNFAVIYSIGDSCIFNINEDKISNAFPIDSPESFNNRPLLLASNNDNNKNSVKYYKSQKIELNHGEKILLMTDALACWFLSNNNNMPWKTLEQIDELENFKKFIFDLRQNKKIKNDDTTLIELNIY